MIANRNYEDCEPITWVGRVPVYLATILAAAHGVAMILSGLAMAAGAQWFFDAFRFSTYGALREGHVWQFVTYAFVSTDPRQFLWTVIQLFLLAIFGRDVEKFIGRKSFVWMYVALLLAAPVYFSLLSLMGGSYLYSGSDALHFAVFVAFVVIYPTAEIFFGLQARWLAAILLGVNSLQLLAVQMPAQLGALWIACGVAVLWIMKEGVGGFSLPSPAAYFRRKNSARKLRVLPDKPEEEFGVHDSIDPILEKIARQGIGSLTRSEREKLERARTALLEK
ncbi:MAG: DUF6576 domain-containing protein, partial [Terrimicrobiaceae bacterium]